MGVIKWLQEKTREIKTAIDETYNQVVIEVKSLPNKAIGEVKNAYASAGEYFFGKKPLSSKRKSISQTKHSKSLTKRERRAYDNYAANFSQGVEPSPEQTRAFMKVQKIKTKKTAPKNKSYHKQQLAADNSIKKSIAKQGEFQYKAYNGAKSVLNFVSFGGADQFEKARNDIERDGILSLSARARAVAGVGLTAVGAYTTITTGANMLYGGSKWIYNLARTSFKEIPKALPAFGRAAIRAVKNPDGALKLVQNTVGYAKKEAVKLLNTVNTGLKNLSAKQLSQSAQTLLRNINADPKTYLLKSGTAVLGGQWGYNAVKDAKAGRKSSAALNALFALTTPSMIRGANPKVLAEIEALSVKYSNEISSFGINALNKFSGGLTRVCGRTIQLAEDIFKSVKNIPQTFNAGLQNLFPGKQLSAAGGYGNLPATPSILAMSVNGAQGGGEILDKIRETTSRLLEKYKHKFPTDVEDMFELLKAELAKEFDGPNPLKGLVYEDFAAFELDLEKKVLTAINTTKHKFLSEAILKALKIKLAGIDTSYSGFLDNPERFLFLAELYLTTLFEKKQLLKMMAENEGEALLSKLCALHETFLAEAKKRENIPVGLQNLKHMSRIMGSMNPQDIFTLLGAEARKKPDVAKKLNKVMQQVLEEAAKGKVLAEKLSGLDGFHASKIDLLPKEDVNKMYDLCKDYTIKQIRSNPQLGDFIVGKINSGFYIRNRCHVIEEAVREELGIKTANLMLNEDLLSNFADRCHLNGNPEVVKTLEETLGKYAEAIVATKDLKAKKQLFDELKKKLIEMIN